MVLITQCHRDILERSSSPHYYKSILIVSVWQKDVPEGAYQLKFQRSSLFDDALRQKELHPWLVLKQSVIYQLVIFRLSELVAFLVGSDEIWRLQMYCWITIRFHEPKTERDIRSIEAHIQTHRWNGCAGSGVNITHVCGFRSVLTAQVPYCSRRSLSPCCCCSV